jgi:hypothetical protein
MRHLLPGTVFQTKKTICVFAMILLLSATQTYHNGICEMNYEMRPWYKCASAYIDYDETIANDTIHDNESALRILGQREQAKTKLLSSAGPTDAELESLLVSSRILDKKIALVNIMLRRVYAENIHSKIIDILNSSDDFFLKFYGYHCVNALDEGRVNHFGNDILAIPRSTIALDT